MATETSKRGTVKMTERKFRQPARPDAQFAFVQGLRGSDSWELHRADCRDVTQSLRRVGVAVYELNCQTADEARHWWIDGELEEIGYTIDDVRVLPCCPPSQQALRSQNTKLMNQILDNPNQQSNPQEMTMTTKTSPVSLKSIRSASAKKGAQTRKAGKEAFLKAQATVDAPKASGRGRKSLLAGKRLFHVTGLNSRIADSFGFRSQQIIIDREGLTYEDFIQAGGRNRDLLWDLAHGVVEAR